MPSQCIQLSKQRINDEEEAEFKRLKIIRNSSRIPTSDTNNETELSTVSKESKQDNSMMSKHVKTKSGSFTNPNTNNVTTVEQIMSHHINIHKPGAPSLIVSNNLYNNMHATNNININKHDGTTSDSHTTTDSGRDSLVDSPVNQAYLSVTNKPYLIEANKKNKSLDTHC